MNRFIVYPLLFLILNLTLGMQRTDAQDVFFSEESGLAPAWSLTAWNGLEVSVTEYQGLRAILAKAGVEGAEAYAGFTIAKWENLVQLDSTALTEGVIALKLNSSTGGEKDLQVSIQLLDANEEGIEGTNKFFPLSDVNHFGGVDAEEETWQSIEIPLKEILDRSEVNPDDVCFLGKIGIQFMGEVSENDLFVTEIELKMP